MWAKIDHITQKKQVVIVYAQIVEKYVFSKKVLILNPYPL